MNGRKTLNSYSTNETTLIKSFETNTMKKDSFTTKYTSINRVNDESFEFYI